MEYDPAVSTHKASSITSTTSTSSNSTWDHPISSTYMVVPRHHSVKIEEEDSDGTISHKFDDYNDRFEASTLVDDRSLIPPKLNDNSDSHHIQSDGHTQKKRRSNGNSGFSSFIDSFINHDDSHNASLLPELISPNTIVVKENHDLGSSHNDESNNNLGIMEAQNSIKTYPIPIYLQHGNQVTMPSVAVTNYNKKRDATTITPNSTIRPTPANAIQPPYERERSDSISSITSNKRSKLNRELLTDDEKRVNHIASEQKRRNTIRLGFKDLTEIIPTLKNINNSKSTVLFKAVEYIKHLDKRNRGLRDKVTALQMHMNLEGRALQEQRYHRQWSLANIKSNSQRYHKVFGKQAQAQPYHHTATYSTSASVHPSDDSLNDLPAHTVSALRAHKNQQKQLEELQEQLRAHHQLLIRHNIVPDNSNKPALPIVLNDDSKESNTEQVQVHNYNSISIPSSRSSNSDENDQYYHRSSLIMPHHGLETQQEPNMSYSIKKIPWQTNFVDSSTL